VSPGRSHHPGDKTDPWFNDQTKVVEQRYKELVGKITAIVREEDARVPLSSGDQLRVADLIVGKTK